MQKEFEYIGALWRNFPDEPRRTGNHNSSKWHPLAPPWSFRKHDPFPFLDYAVDSLIAEKIENRRFFFQIRADFRNSKWHDRSSILKKCRSRAIYRFYGEDYPWNYRVDHCFPFSRGISNKRRRKVYFESIYLLIYSIEMQKVLADPLSKVSAWFPSLHL